MGWPLAAAVIGSSLLGGYSANKAAKQQAQAQRDAANIQAEAFRFYQPYIEDTINRGTDALDAQLETGAYTGVTRAGMDPNTTAGLNYGITQAQRLAGVPQSFMDATSGFVGNYNDLYRRANDLNADGTYANSVLNNAVAYGTQSPQARAMVDSIMRDETNRLYEGTLPTLNRQASATNNANSSRAAVAEAVARRGYEDRRADVAANVADRLTGRYVDQYNRGFNQAVGLNSQLGNVYNNAFKMIPAIGNMQVTAGDRFQQDAQGILDDNRMRFEDQRDFNMNAISGYNQGILGQAVRQSPQNPTMVTASPEAAAAGGFMTGAGFGLDVYDAFNSRNPGTGQTGGYSADRYFYTPPLT
jgi:hypothetical protein